MVWPDAVEGFKIFLEKSRTRAIPPPRAKKLEKLSKLRFSSFFAEIRWKVSTLKGEASWRQRELTISLNQSITNLLSKISTKIYITAQYPSPVKIDFSYQNPHVKINAN